MPLPCAQDGDLAIVVGLGFKHLDLALGLGRARRRGQRRQVPGPLERRECGLSGRDLAAISISDHPVHLFAPPLEGEQTRESKEESDPGLSERYGTVVRMTRPPLSERYGLAGLPQQRHLSRASRAAALDADKADLL